MSQLTDKIVKRIIELNKIQSNLIEELADQPVNWDEVPIDTLILVRNSIGISSNWYKAYFAEFDFSKKRVRVYPYGGTSQTQTNKETVEYAKLIKEDSGSIN